MTLFMVFAIAIFLSILALLWCFRGFTRELAKPRKRIGILVCLKEVQPQRNELVGAASAKTGSFAYPSNPSLRAAGVISLALLLGSR